MGRIELRYCSPYIRDGLSGSAAVNQASAVPVAGNTSLVINEVVLNTKIPAQVPIGARFTIVGETVPVAHVVTSRSLQAGGAVNEAQLVALDSTANGAPTGGTFTLTFGPTTTGPIAFDATTTAVASALAAMTGYSAACWSVSGSPGAWVVTFTGPLGGAPQALLVGDGTLLIGGAGVITTVTVTATVTGEPANYATTTTEIGFAPALGAGTYTATAALTFKPQLLYVKIGDGDLKYSENDQFHYDLDRDRLDVVRQGADVPMEVSLNFTWEYTRSGTGQAISPLEAIKRVGAASEWVSSCPDDCQPYSVDLIVDYIPPCATANEETYVFPMFRAEKRDHDFKTANVSVNGKCNVTEPVISRGAPSFLVGPQGTVSVILSDPIVEV